MRRAGRCAERGKLEFHHDDPYALGGDHDAARIRLLCRRHNVYLAERDFGKSVMEKYRNRGGRVSDTAPGYGFIADFDCLDPKHRVPPAISRDNEFSDLGHSCRNETIGSIRIASRAGR